MKGVVNPQGQTTNYFFNYGTTASYGQKTSEKSVGAGTTDVNASDSADGPLPGHRPTTSSSSPKAPGDDTRPGRDIHDRTHSSASPATAAPRATRDPGAAADTVPDSA